MKLIGIAGKARSGKDSIAEYLVDFFNAHRYALADPLKEACSVAFGIPLHKFYEAEFKETIDEFWQLSPREIAQRFGTECMREQFREDFWLKRALFELEDVAYNEDRDYFVIPDIRFENEADWIRERGGELWHVVRPSIGEGVVRAHASEAGVDAKNEDIVFFNDGDLDHLFDLVEARIADIKAGI